MVGLFDILLIAGVGLGVLYFLNVGNGGGGDPCAATRHDCPLGQIQAWNEVQHACVCGPMPL